MMFVWRSAEISRDEIQQLMKFIPLKLDLTKFLTFPKEQVKQLPTFSLRGLLWYHTQLYCTTNQQPKQNKTNTTIQPYKKYIFNSILFLLFNHVFFLYFFSSYYGKHYVAIFYSDTYHDFLMFDDKRVVRVGTWSQVYEKCSKGKLQPILLFYENMETLSSFQPTYEAATGMLARLPYQPPNNGNVGKKDATTSVTTTASSTSNSSSSTNSTSSSSLSSAASSVLRFFDPDTSPLVQAPIDMMNRMMIEIKKSTTGTSVTSPSTNNTNTNEVSANVSSSSALIPSPNSDVSSSSSNSSITAVATLRPLTTPSKSTNRSHSPTPPTSHRSLVPPPNITINNNNTNSPSAPTTANITTNTVPIQLSSCPTSRQTSYDSGTYSTSTTSSSTALFPPQSSQPSSSNIIDTSMMDVDSTGHDIGINHHHHAITNSTTNNNSVNNARIHELMQIPAMIPLPTFPQQQQHPSSPPDYLSSTTPSASLPTSTSVTHIPRSFSAASSPSILSSTSPTSPMQFELKQDTEGIVDVSQYLFETTNENFGGYAKLLPEFQQQQGPFSTIKEEKKSSSSSSSSARASYYLCHECGRMWSTFFIPNQQCPMCITNNNKDDEPFEEKENNKNQPPRYVWINNSFSCYFT